VATVYFRGNRAYLNWSQGGEQHRKSLGQISKFEAETRRQAKELELRTGTAVAGFRPSELFGVAAVKYLEWHSTQFPDSHKRVAFIVEKRLTRFHDRPLATITQHDVEAWIADIGKEVRVTKTEAGKVTRRGPIAADTVEKELRTLKALFNKAIEWKLVDQSPAEYVAAPRKLESKPVHWYSVTELQKLYAADPLHAHIWQFMANTGLRRREAMQLKWQEVRDGCVWVLSREGERTKSGKWRQVPLSPGAERCLARLKEGNTTLYVLPRMAKESWTRAFAKAAERAELGGSLHSLRHSFGANLVSDGKSLRVVQKLMGHATIATTEQYGHVGENALQSAVSGLSL
jgi:integrase